MKLSKRLLLAAMGWVFVAGVAAVPASAQVLDAAETPNAVRMNTLFGPTGLIVVPTAHVTPYNSLNVGATYTEDDWSASGNAGIYPGLEVGGAFYDIKNGDEEGLLNIKFNPTLEEFGRFDIGIGIADALDAIDSSPYAVVSTTLWEPPAGDLRENAIAIRGHLGYGGGLFDDSIIGGAELFLTDAISFVTEYDGDDVNASVRFASSEEPIRIQAGILKEDFFISATYQLAF